MFINMIYFSHLQWLKSFFFSFFLFKQTRIWLETNNNIQRIRICGASRWLDRNKCPCRCKQANSQHSFLRWKRDGGCCCSRGPCIRSGGHQSQRCKLVFFCLFVCFLCEMDRLLLVINSVEWHICVENLVFMFSDIYCECETRTVTSRELEQHF